MKVKLLLGLLSLVLCLGVFSADKVYLSCDSGYKLKKDGSDTYTCKTSSKVEVLETPSAPSGYDYKVSSKYDFQKVTVKKKDGQCIGKKWRKCSDGYGCYKSNCTGYVSWSCKSGYTSTEGDGREPSSVKQPCQKEDIDYKKGSCQSGFSYKKNHSGNTDKCQDKAHDYKRPNVTNK